MLELDQEPREDDGLGSPLMSEQEFDEEVEQAARGEWEALGLDAPDKPVETEKFRPASIEEFMKDAS